MEIISNGRIEAANLILAAAKGNYSAEQKENAATIIGEDIDLFARVFSAMIDRYHGKFMNGELKRSTCKNAIRNEYRAIGLPSVMDYKYVREFVDLSFDQYGETAEFAVSIKMMNQVWSNNRTCPNIRLKNGVSIFCLSLMYRYNLITEDVEFTREILDEINGMTEAEKKAAVIPNVKALS